MGFFGPSSDGHLTIDFYDDPQQTLEHSVASVVYTNRNASTARLAQDFAFYVDKILHALGRGEPSARLVRSLGSVLAQPLSRSTNALEGDGFSVKLVEPREGHRKRCEASFYPKSGPVTKFSWGGEDYYPPISCLVFLQYIVNNLPERELSIFDGAVRQAMGMV